MNKIQAMTAIEDILKSNFKYLYQKQRSTMQMLHLSFLMDSRTHNVQMTFDFQENWVDILCFISPTIAIKEEKTYFNVIQTVNYLNWHIKSFGRFYLDEYGDFAYSLRFSYAMLEQAQNMCAKEMETAIDYYADIFVLILDVLQGKMAFDEAKEFIDNMW